MGSDARPSPLEALSASRQVLLREYDAIVGAVVELKRDQWKAPTRLRGWRVLELVQHIAPLGDHMAASFRAIGGPADSGRRRSGVVDDRS